MPEILIDQSRRRAYLNEAEVPLSPQEYRVLYCLGHHAEEVVPKETLLAAMWSTPEQVRADFAGFTPAAVDLVIFRLRKKLGDDAQAPLYLETRRGFGYILHHVRVINNETDGLHMPMAEEVTPPFIQPCPSVASTHKPPALAQPWAALTRREWSVFLALGDEQSIRLTDKALAQQLHMAEGTLKKHLQHIYRKLDVENRSGAALLALRVKAHFPAT